MFGQTVSWEQPIEVAEENASLYRLPGLYHNAGTRYSVAGSPEYSGYDSASRTFKFNCCGLVPYGGSLAQLTDWDDDTFVLSE